VLVFCRSKNAVRKEIKITGTNSWQTNSTHICKNNWYTTTLHKESNSWQTKKNKCSAHTENKQVAPKEITISTADKELKTIAHKELPVHASLRTEKQTTFTQTSKQSANKEN